MANELKKECGLGMYWCNTDNKCKLIQEDAPTNSVGDGSRVAGLGVGPQGEPGIKRKKKVASFISFMRRKAPV